SRLPELCGALRGVGRPEAARLLAAGAWRWMSSQLQGWTTTVRNEVRKPQLEMLSSPLVRQLEAADDKLRDEITGALREYEDNILECLMPALRLADARRATGGGLDIVAQDCAQRLRTIIARPLRDEDDWSIEWTGCGCGICDTLGTFLSSRSRRTFTWPLAKDGRRHVHTKIDLAGLPVRHHTRRQGRPYTLELTKTNELFTRATNARNRAETDLEWLTSTWVTHRRERKAAK
ncbi:2OG-Fe(II) oxygenase, partial [Kibdelosporangium lantanae]